MQHLDESLLNEYLDQALDEPTRQVVEAHLAICPDCRTALDKLRFVFSTLAELPEQLLERDLTPAVLAQAITQNLSPGWRWLLAIEGALTLGALAFLSQRLKLPLQLPDFDASHWLSANPLEIWSNLQALRPTLPPIRLPEFELPALRLSALSPSWDGQTMLAVAVLTGVLWVAGNALLLVNRPEVRK
jgi:anti-sigma factor RsiW